jgi:ribosomal protein S18 acetylase RimI-like enzyme
MMYALLTEVNIQSYPRELTALWELFAISCGKEDPAAIRQIIQLERMRGTRYLVAKIDDEIIGFVGYWYPTGNQDFEPPQLIDLAVLPSYRRQGIGRDLVQAAIEQLQEAGCCKVMILMNSNRLEDLGFLSQCGFEMISLIADWCGAGVSRAIFRKDI